MTRGPHKERQNLGIYRQQLIGKKQTDYALVVASRRRAGFPRSGVRRIRANVSRFLWRWVLIPPQFSVQSPPVPDTLSEYAFAGLLRGTKTEVVKCISNDLEVPASAEIVLEGYIEQGETAPEGPYGDHTGYYNEVDSFPVFTVTHITQREDAIYHSTYTGRPPDEPAVLGVALNEVFVPILQKTVPGNCRFLPAAGRLLLSPGGSDDQKNSTPDTRSAS